MHPIAVDRPPKIALHEPVSNNQRYRTIFKVVGAAVNFFQKMDIPASKRAEVVGIGVLLIPPEMGWAQRVKMIRAIAAIPGPVTKRDVLLALKLINPEMDEIARIEILQAVMDIPASKRAEVVGIAVLLITLEMGWADRVNMIQATVAIRQPIKESDVFLVLKLITEKMGWFPRMKIFRAVMEVPAERRAQVIGLVVLLTTPKQIFYRRIELIEAIAHMPPSVKESDAFLALKVIGESMDPIERVGIFQAVLDVPAQKRAEVVEKAFPFIKPEMGWLDRIEIIRVMGLVGITESDLALALEVSPPEIDEISRIRMIGAVINVLVHKRAKVVGNALLLIKPEMGCDDRRSLIRWVAKIDVEKAVVVLALGAVTEGMEWDSRISILRAVANLPARERDDIMPHALRLFNLEMHADDRIDIIEQVAGVRAAERAQYVRQRLWGVQAQNDRLAAEHGIDVHKGKRDRQVRAAIQLLRQHQSEMPKERIDQAVWEFTQYLKDYKNAEHKKLALNALMAPKEEGESFGPLFDNVEFTIMGLPILGEEIIGRLWIFVSKLTGSEQTNGKESMVSGLKDSYDEFMGKVCNPGKVQRLVVGVLQGRLPGVSIELKEGMKVTAKQGARMFFAMEAHRAIRQLEPLLKAANRFCDENPLVNRGEFLEEIGEFVRAEGIVA